MLSSDVTHTLSSLAAYSHNSTVCLITPVAGEFGVIENRERILGKLVDFRVGNCSIMVLGKK